MSEFSKYLDIQINICDADQFNEIVYSTTGTYEKKLYLYKNKDHYNVFTSMPAFINTDYYCHVRKKGYTQKNKHKCPNIA